MTDAIETKAERALEVGSETLTKQRVRKAIECLPKPLVSVSIAVIANIPEMEDVFGDYHVPVWAKAFARTFISTVSPDLIKKPASDGDLETIGLILGRLSAISEAIKADLTSREKPMYEPFLELANDLTQLGIKSSLELTIEAQNRFFIAYAKGLEWKGLDRMAVNGAINIGSPRFLLALVLLAKWPEVEAAGTTTALHGFLTKSLKLAPKFVRDLETFRRYCVRNGVFRKPKEIK